jgi:predicted metal-dependent hydrolase
MRESIEYGSKTIEFQLQYSNRKTLGITVTPEQNIIVKAPDNTSLAAIKEKVKKKAPWIIKQQSFFLSFEPRTPERRYISGETHLYLGRQYRLKVVESQTEWIKIKGPFIEVATLDKSKVREQVKSWYLKNAKNKIIPIAEKLIERFKKYEVEASEIVFREMPTRWGSCTPKGKIILNPELIKAPKGCIEYVIIHELCHLVHRDHTPKFIELQDKEMPRWEKWKMKLEKLMA